MPTLRNKGFVRLYYYFHYGGHDETLARRKESDGASS